MSDAKKFYCEKFWDNAPLFHQPWWLNAAAGDSWDVGLIKNQENLSAYFLYARKQNFLGTHLIMPPLTQFLGPNYRLSASSPRERLNEEMEILEKLLVQIPPAASFESRWHFQFQNWLPFHWNGFKQTTRYTYLLEDISDPDALSKNFSDKINREINKAGKQFSLAEAEDSSGLYELIGINFRDKKLSVPFSQSFMEGLFNASKQNNSGKIFLAKDSSGKVAAGIFVAWDAHTAYYIIGGKNDDFGNSGAMSFLFRETFNQLKTRVSAFDFEGSMIRGVENYFRSFGPVQKEFFQIEKTNSRLLQLKAFAKSFRRSS